MTGPTRDLVIVGAGGHGRELFDTVRAVNEQGGEFRVLGFVDDAPAHLDRLERLGADLLGDTDWLADRSCTYGLGIGSPEVRREVAARLDRAGCEAATIVHPDCHVGADVRLGAGVVVYTRCTITTNVRIGSHTHLNVGCAVQHDSSIGEFVQLSPGVFVNGDCRIGDGAFLGTGAIVTRGTTIGDGARIGAGAVVLDDVPAGVTVVGAPARGR